MPEELGKIEQLDSGLHPSLPHDRVPLWADGLNVTFNEQAVQPFPGQFSIFSKLDSSPVKGMYEVQVEGEKILYWGSCQKLFRYVESKGVPEEITGTAVLTDNLYDGVFAETATQKVTQWSFERWGRWMLATNGVNTPQIYVPPTPVTGAPGEYTDLLEQPGATALPFDTAEIFRAIGPHMLALNLRRNGVKTGDTYSIVDDESNGYAWSGFDDVELWTPAASNQAGENIIRDMKTEIVAAVPLGRGIGVYGRAGLWLIDFVGAPFFFGHQHLLSGIGALSKHSVVPVGRMHYGMGQFGIFRTDGLQFEYIDQPAVHDFIYELNKLNRNQLSHVSHLHDPLTSTIIWFYPAEDDSVENTNAIAYNYKNKTWSIPNFIRTASAEGSVFNRPLSADKFGNIYVQGVEGTAPSGAIAPLLLEAEADLALGWGEGGWGELGWGGELSMEG